MTQTPVTPVTIARSTVVSTTHEPLCKLEFRCILDDVGMGNKMDQFISKAWPNHTLHDIAERTVMLSVLVVVVVALLRMLLNVG